MPTERQRLTGGTTPADLNAVVLFAKVVERGSFAAAARALRQPKATVSRKVAELEARLGARLLHRSTRALSLTDAGRRYLEHARRIADELEAAEAAVAESRDEPSGLVRLTAPVLIAQTFLGPILAEYAALHPKVRVLLDVTNRRVDLVEGGYDLAVRAGALARSGLVARRLGRGVARLYASPAYLARAGAPGEPDELARHALIDERAGAMPDGEWRLYHAGGAERAVRVTPRLGVSDAVVAAAWAVADLGVARLPTFVAAPHVLAGRLAPVLGAWQFGALEISALYPSRRGLHPALRALLDLLARRLGEPLERAGRAAGAAARDARQQVGRGDLAEGGGRAARRGRLGPAATAADGEASSAERSRPDAEIVTG